MATWNVGPFDNDDAVDWCVRLEALSALGQVEALARTINLVQSRGADLSDAEASEAVAAAATVLQVHTGRPDVDALYAPRFLLETDHIVATSELRRSAVSALDLIMTSGSIWRARWAGHVEEDEAREALARIRDTLANG